MGHDRGLKWIRVVAALSLLAATFSAVSPTGIASAASDCSGTVFRDDDYDGARDADEIGIGNVTVNVYSDAPVADTLVATTITAADGSYTLEALPDDLAMRVEFVDLPAGHLEGPAGPDSGPLIRFTNSSNCGVLDAGIVLPSACSVLQVEVGNRVWFDEDADGVQDAEETAVAGVTVSLYDALGTLVASTLTDERLISTAAQTQTRLSMSAATNRRIESMSTLGLFLLLRSVTSSSSMPAVMVFKTPATAGRRGSPSICTTRTEPSWPRRPPMRMGPIASMGCGPERMRSR